MQNWKKYKCKIGRNINIKLGEIYLKIRRNINT